ncbi:hypothetical protein BC941DRAFT_121741 [Chlamydoabsidia padenii]|nr:hypothetical protein BC941DRAFT_121741 [Chlamydoabsidia padenii]
MDPLRDRPEGYHSLYELYYSSPIEDLTNALGRMRVSSPPQVTSQPGPLLLYVEMTVVHQDTQQQLKFGWKNKLARSTLCLVYDHSRRQGMVCLGTRNMLTFAVAMEIHDGDVLGLSYDQQNQFGFTLNGTLLALVRLDGLFLPYLPITMGPVKIRTNYGQAPFQYSTEDPRPAMVQYLSRLHWLHLDN